MPSGSVDDEVETRTVEATVVIEGGVCSVE